MNTRFWMNAGLRAGLCAACATWAALPVEAATTPPRAAKKAAPHAKKSQAKKPQAKKPAAPAKTPEAPVVVAPQAPIVAPEVPIVTPDALPKTPYQQALEAAPSTSLLVLDPGDKVWALHVTSGAKLQVARGDAVVDSSHRSALWVADGTVDVARGALRVVGGVNRMGRPVISPAPLTGASAVYDPFPDFSVPPPQLVSPSKLFLNDAEITLRPGIYTDGIFAGGTVKHIMMPPGLYVMNGGDFFASGALIEGQGVTILLGGAQPGALWTGAGTRFNLSAPTEGPLQRMLVIARGKTSEGVRLEGTVGTLDGVVYAPRCGVALSGKSDVTLPRLLCADLSLVLGARLQVSGADVPDAAKLGG